ncbi:MAG: hypothetical protein DUW69_001894 [Verrucomicrobia bacterium]|jgi:hypothetical protein|nr:MAG: hypothetical protein DUW69_001894 [Verrucomicrobiota bacterium]
MQDVTEAGILGKIVRPEARIGLSAEGWFQGEARKPETENCDGHLSLAPGFLASGDKNLPEPP